MPTRRKDAVDEETGILSITRERWPASHLGLFLVDLFLLNLVGLGEKPPLALSSCNFVFYFPSPLCPLSPHKS